MDTVEALIHAGANAVKLEGIDGIEDVVERVVLAGVPVMGHLGLTPTSREPSRWVQGARW